ncbi:Uma2 family endonuclease [Leptolyngbya sp. NIES-2104]|uniref:Uma2 family endonuclease n=1 Tax=Leptolyngbya sp. NIES-2104 TaxID=1552121 RepID=UPI0006EC6675|nr:Uma2 family endonuclease [Leptolyngbya sp. NIES-2104]GAP98447.1 flavodoxin reductase (ferredoxin-NADPH reductase) family 1 [Leptolyngbya sp. NIES-2104]
MSATLIQSPDRVILRNISWQSYQSLVRDFESEPCLRLTYDRGTLEIRMPLDPHESFKKLLGRLIEAATEELDLEIRSLGSRTCDREDLSKGLEPDQCYYIQNEAQVRGVAQINLGHFPPPDLAVEVDITSSSLNRFSIYAALNVPEVWRFDGESLTIYSLQAGEYQICDRSLALPILTAADVMRFLGQYSSIGENRLIKQFRQWVRNH